MNTPIGSARHRESVSPRSLGAFEYAKRTARILAELGVLEDVVDALAADRDPGRRFAITVRTLRGDPS